MSNRRYKRGLRFWVLGLAVLVSCTGLAAFAAPAALAASGGTISTFAGNGTAGYNLDSQPATNAELNSPTGVAVDSNGDTLIGDSSNARVRLVAGSSCLSASTCPYGLSSMTQGDIYTVAGDGTRGYSGDGGAATSAEITGQQFEAVDTSGDLLIAASSRLRLVAAASCASSCPYGLSSMTKGYIYTIAGTANLG